MRRQQPNSDSRAGDGWEPEAAGRRVGPWILAVAVAVALAGWWGTDLQGEQTKGLPIDAPATATRTPLARPTPGTLAQILDGEWNAVPPAPVDPPGMHRAAWTGSELIVFGRGGTEAAAYDPVAGRWRLLPPPPLPRNEDRAVVWTGREVLVWGGTHIRLGRRSTGGAAYDPAADRWRLLAGAPITQRLLPTWAWTGRELVIWGGLSFRGGNRPLNDGAAYDPVADTWRSLAPGPVDGVVPAGAVWTGRQMLVWGGSADASTNGAGFALAYDPSSDRWERLGPPTLVGLREATGVWTGEALLLLSGQGRRQLGQPYTAATYEPAPGRWRVLWTIRSLRLELALRQGHLAAVWTGDRMLAYGGRPSVGVAYTPASHEWMLLPHGGAARTSPVAIWTGDSLLLWGGAGPRGSRVDGALWTPAPDR